MWETGVWKGSESKFKAEVFMLSAVIALFAVSKSFYFSHEVSVGLTFSAGLGN